MAHEKSPSSVMYGELKTLGLSNYDAALILLDTDRQLGKVSLRDRIESRTHLSRFIVHAAPGEMGEGLFRDFATSSQSIMSNIVLKLRKNQQRNAPLAISERLSGPAAQAMQDALDAYGLDSGVYRHALAHIANLDLDSDADRALLYVMLFVTCGCTGDPHKAASTVERFSNNRVGTAFRTTEARISPDQDSEANKDDEASMALGLMRIVNGRLKGPDALYVISESEQGTEIGTFASGPNAITDVDEDVSRHHARIYKENGRYFIIGEKSTNGTTVITSDDKIEHVVEPPRKERPRDYTPEPFELFPTDTICLGASTRFMVMPLA